MKRNAAYSEGRLINQPLLALTYTHSSSGSNSSSNGVGGRRFHYTVYIYTYTSAAEARKAAGANAGPRLYIYSRLRRIHNAREKVLIIDAFFIVIDFFFLPETS